MLRSIVRVKNSITEIIDKFYIEDVTFYCFNIFLNA